jgi:hypothetical protein
VRSGVVLRTHFLETWLVEAEVLFTLESAAIALGLVSRALGGRAAGNELAGSRAICLRFDWAYATTKREGELLNRSTNQGQVSLLAHAARFSTSSGRWVNSAENKLYVLLWDAPVVART